ncbi:hypothetical protein KSP40_PGU007035 [Platanthera guangdongensis]|uniref:Uncharacterized protein n=1 Tax=Platanthera guangdongensis TaxID=2320717 RepID=A0ABR2LCL6_9ASPA
MAAERNMEVEDPVRCADNASSSPEFEFWMVHNPSLHPPDLLTADEIFVDGVLLPLQLLSLSCSERPALPHSNSPGSPTEPMTSIIYSSTSRQIQPSLEAPACRGWCKRSDREIGEPDELPG